MTHCLYNIMWLLVIVLLMSLLLIDLYHVFSIIL